MCVAATLAACASVGSAVPVPSAPPAERVAAIGAMDARLIDVFFRLATANHDLCPAQGWSAGWMLHAASQYEPDVRAVLLAEGLEGDLPAVSAVAPGGPAAQAGLRRGDVILSADGIAMQAGGPAGRANYDGVKRNLDLLDQATDDGSRLRLTIRRQGVVIPVEMTLRAACDYAVHLDVSDEYAAKADGTSVLITSALLLHAASADELAVVVAHELAHDVLGHHQALTRAAPARRVFGDMAAPGRVREAEREADRVGLYLMANAGFDYHVAPAFWVRTAREIPQSDWFQWGHPPARERAERAAQTISHLDATRQPDARWAW